MLFNHCNESLASKFSSSFDEYGTTKSGALCKTLVTKPLNSKSCTADFDMEPRNPSNTGLLDLKSDHTYFSVAKIYKNSHKNIKILK